MLRGTQRGVADGCHFERRRCGPDGGVEVVGLGLAVGEDGVERRAEGAVAGLTRRGLVAKRDIDWMFASFIGRVVSVDFVRDYVLRSDFEELQDAARAASKRRK